ncbi:MAG: FmdB family transcriptional regulator [Pirellulales bacterium]
MPTYVYEVILDDGEGGEQFEVYQRMSDEPLKTHPETGAPVRRVFQPPGITGLASMNRAEKSVKDDKKLEQMGFTKYVKSGDGTYEKVCGKGPNMINKGE